MASETFLEVEKEAARQAGSASLLAERQLQKSGATIFAVESVAAEISPTAFYPAAVYNELRRRALAHHETVRLAGYQPQRVELKGNDVQWPETEVSYLDNIANRKAEAFYRRHGVRRIDRTALQAEKVAECALMTTRYCVKAQLGICPKDKNRSGEDPVGPLTLSDNTGDYELEFDCRRCGMVVRRKK